MASKSKTTTSKGTLGAPLRGLMAGVAVIMAASAIPATASASLNQTIKERILRQADNVNRLAQTRVDLLSNEEGRRLADLLNQAAIILRDGSGGGYNPYPGPNPYPGYPTPYPPHGGLNSYSVNARLGNMDVSFDGYGLEALNQQCRSYLTQRVYSIQVNGKTITDTYNGFSAQQTCAILTLNARALSGHAFIELNAKVGVASISLRVGTQLELQGAIDLLIPQLTANSRVYSFEVNGRTYTDSYNGFTTAALVAILKGNTKDAYGLLISEGTLGNVPFVFSGNIGNEIETQCLDYYRAVFGTSRIHSIVVNGQRRTDSYNGFTASQTCMTVKSLAKHQR